MAIATYSDLQTAIINWTHRSDLSSVAPDFITLAEAKFNRQIRHPKMLKRSQASIVTGWTAFPDDFIELSHLEVNGERIPQVAYSDLDDMYADETGVTQVFAVTDEQFRIAPYTAGQTVEIIYFAEVPALSDSNTTNWLLTQSPDLYLSASLVEAFQYLNDPAMVQTQAAIALQAMQALKRDGNRRRYGENGMELGLDLPKTYSTYNINRGY